MKLRLSIYVIRCIAYGKVRNVEQLANAPQGVYMFSYQGTTKCHLVSTLIPIETKKPSSAQMHVCDIDMEAQVKYSNAVLWTAWIGRSWQHSGVSLVKRS
jgi:hypothetical protein